MTPEGITPRSPWADRYAGVVLAQVGKESVTWQHRIDTLADAGKGGWSR